MVQVIPAILTNSPDEARNLIAKAQDVAIERVQIDIIDGIYVNNKTIDPAIFEDIDTSLKLDFHLMVKDPIHWVEKCIRGGADRIIGQIEMMSSQGDFINKIGGFGIKTGLAIDLKTPVTSLEESTLIDVDIVLVMSVPAGFGGQEFNLSVWEKVETLVKMRKEKELKFKICVDGGVTTELMNDMEKAGVNEVAVGAKRYLETYAQD